MSGAEEERKRAARAEQVALFRYQLVREAADPALSTRQRGRMVREIASKAHQGPFGEPVPCARDDRPVDPGLARRRVRGAGPAGPAGDPADGRGGPGDGSGAEAGERGPDRRPGAADLGEGVRLVAVGADAAAALRAAGAPGPAGRAAAGGVLPVRVRGAERDVDRRRPARPAHRWPEGVPVLLHRRPLESGDGRPLGLFRVHRPAGGRAAAGAGRPRRSCPAIHR